MGIATRRPRFGTTHEGGRVITRFSPALFRSTYSASTRAGFINYGCVRFARAAGGSPPRDCESFGDELGLGMFR